MANVATVTLNPSIDLFAETRQLVENGKTRCYDTSHEPGGGGINVARNLHRFGVEVVAILTAGGPQGELLKRAIKRESFDFHCVDIAGETRQCVAVTEKASGKLFHLVFPGPELRESEWQQCRNTLEALQPTPEYAVLSGSLPEGVPEDFYGTLAGSVAARDIRVIVDTSGKVLSATKNRGVYLTKLNFEEFTGLGYSGTKKYPEILEAMEQMVKEGLADNLIVTLDADGALLASNEGEKLYARPPETQVVSHVGAGDSFVSAMIHQLVSGKAMADAFRFGVAAAAAKVSTPGNHLLDLEKVTAIAEKVTIRDMGKLR